ncbi:MAG: hypothetical protein ABIH79_02150 [archaeon]
MSWFFIPIRKESNPTRLLLEADDLAGAIERVRNFPEYINNLEKQSFKNQQELGPSYFLEDEFIKKYGSKSDTRREPEEVFSCSLRKGSNQSGENLCKGYSNEISNKLCIIHTPRFKSDLSNDCPYRTKKSNYVTFIED